MATVKELRDLARKRNIKGFSTMKKADLQKALETPPPKPPRLKSKAEQAKNPVKQVQPPKKAPAKKAPEPATKASADNAKELARKNYMKAKETALAFSKKIFKDSEDELKRLKAIPSKQLSKKMLQDQAREYNKTQPLKDLKITINKSRPALLKSIAYSKKYDAVKEAELNEKTTKLYKDFKKKYGEEPQKIKEPAKKAPATLEEMRKQLKDKGVKGTASMKKYELETRLAPRQPALVKKYSDTAFRNLEVFYNDYDDDFPEELLKKNESLLKELELFLSPKGMNASLAINRGKAFDDVYKEKTMELIQKLDKAFKINIAKGKIDFIG